MTIGLAWVSDRVPGRRHLYIASDSRTRGAMVIDCNPKVMTLPRSDCAICFAGNTAATYPLMMQLSNAIGFHQPALDRSLDIQTLKQHLLRVFSDFVGGITDRTDTIQSGDVQFIFAGYSWLSKTFKIWTIYYSEKDRKFCARDSKSFHPLLSKVAFIGDKAKEARSLLVNQLNNCDEKDLPADFEYEPFKVLRKMLRDGTSNSTIGGAPQLVRIGEHMNARVLAVKWPDGPSGHVTLLGRRLFDYENVDNWILDPDTFAIARPRSFGNREESLTKNIQPATILEDS